MVPSISQFPTSPSSEPSLVPSGQPSGQPSCNPTKTPEPTVFVAPVTNTLGGSDGALIPPEGIFFIVAGGVGLAVTAWYFYENRKQKNTNDGLVKEMRGHFTPVGAPRGRAGGGGGNVQLGTAAAVGTAGAAGGYAAGRGGNGGNAGGEMDMGNIYGSNDDDGTFSAANSDLTQSIVEMEEFENGDILHPPRPPHAEHSPPPSPSASLLSRQDSAAGTGNSTTRGPSPPRRQASLRRGNSPVRSARGNSSRVLQSSDSSVSSRSVHL